MPTAVSREPPQNTNERTSGGESHEDDVHLGIDGAGFGPVGIQAEVDRAAYDLSCDAEGKPDPEEAAFAECLGVGEGDGYCQQAILSTLEKNTPASIPQKRPADSPHVAAPNSMSHFVPCTLLRYSPAQ